MMRMLDKLFGRTNCDINHGRKVIKKGELLWVDGVIYKIVQRLKDGWVIAESEDNRVVSVCIRGL